MELNFEEQTTEAREEMREELSDNTLSPRCPPCPLHVSVTLVLQPKKSCRVPRKKDCSNGGFGGQARPPLFRLQAVT